MRFAAVIALSITGALATAYAHVPQGRGSVTVPQVTPTPQTATTGPAAPPLVTTGIIVGRVIDASTGSPVAGAIVSLNGLISRAAPTGGPAGTGRAALAGVPNPTPRMLTDSEGRFAFRNLTRGSYTLIATKPGYSPGAYGRSRPEGQTRNLTLDDNERVSDTVIRLFKFATITGRVMDDIGEPIVGARVVAYRRVLLAGRRRFREVTSTQTDDRGIYRLQGLVPADYAVVAPLSAVTAPNGQSAANNVNFAMSSMTVTGVGPGVNSGGRPLGPQGNFVMQSDSIALSADASGKSRGYATQYYPASRGIGSAEILTLASGEDRSGIDIQMRYVPVSTVSGTLTVPSGSPANLVLRLIPTDVGDMAFEPESASAATDPNGAFMFAGVPLGQYTIQVTRLSREPQFFSIDMGVDAGGRAIVSNVSGTPLPPSAPDPMLWATVPVTVGENDVTGIAVAMQEGFTIAGRFEFTGTRPRPDPQRLTTIPVTIEPADARDNVSQNGPPSRSSADGRFMTAPRPPGKYLLRVGGAPSGFIVQSIMVNGVNATDTPFDLTGNVTSAIVTFTDQISGVAGTVHGVDPGDDPPLVVIFPADSRGWKDYGFNPLRLKSTRAPTPGNFSLGSLVAGDYFVVAIPDEFSAEFQDPAYLELLSRGAERFTLGQGEKRSVSIDIAHVRPPGIGREPIAAVDPGSRDPELRDEMEPWAFRPGETPDGSIGGPQNPPASRDQSAQIPTGTGSISGTITIDDGSPRPGRLARVRISNPQLGSAGDRTALTDEAGRYTIAWLPPGDYNVTVSKPAYLSSSYGAKRVMGAGTPVHVGAGQAVSNIDVTMPKGAVISGAIFDDSGQPAAGVRLQFLTFTRREGERVLTSAPPPGGPPLTNDRGEFRVYGLRPGKYVLSVQSVTTVAGQELRQLTDSEMRAAIADAAKSPTPLTLIDTPRTLAPAAANDAPAPPSVGRAVSYSPVYYPGTVMEQEAVELTVAAGQELTGINMQLRLVPASRIDGRVIGPDGQVAAEAQVALLRFTATGTSSSNLQQKAGTFQAGGVPAGRWLLTAQLDPARIGRGGAAGATASWAQLDLYLNGDDQRDLVLALAPLPSISGRIVFEDGTAPSMSAIQVRVETAGSSSNTLASIRESRPATPDANGEFTIANVMPGKYRIVASAVVRPGEVASPGGPVGLAAAWSVAAATIAGQDAYVSSFEVRQGQPLTDALVTMTNKPSEISGRLVDANNKPALNMTVVLFPVDRSLWVANSARVNRISRPNASGTFSFPTAVPGEYYLAVLTELDNNDWQDVDFKEQLVPSSIKVTVGKGEKKVQDMRIGG